MANSDSPTTPRTIVATSVPLTLRLTAAFVSPGYPVDGSSAFAVADFSGTGKAEIAWAGPLSDFPGHYINQVILSGMDGGNIARVHRVEHPARGGGGPANIAAQIANKQPIPFLLSKDWTFAGIGDFNYDGHADFLWQENGRINTLMLNDTGAPIALGTSIGQMGTEWHVAGTGDVNGDGHDDVIWANTNGQAQTFMMNGDGTTLLAVNVVADARMGAEWRLVGTGDFNGDGRAELLWANNDGQIAEWTMNGATLAGFAISSGKNGAEWQVAGVADFNHDGMSDVMWQSTSGDVQMWFMHGATVAQVAPLTGRMGPEWHIVGASDLTGDGTPDIVWSDGSRQEATWFLDTVGNTVTGGNSQDIFVFNHIAYAGMEITDFQPGMGGGTLNIHGLLNSVGYSGSNPLADGQVRLVQSGANTTVQVQAHPGTWEYVTVVTLDNVVKEAMVSTNWIL